MAVQKAKAILLATGETNKLHPLTEIMPAPMTPVVNRPIMAYMVELLARQEIKDIVVSLYHLPGQIEAYFGNGRRWGVSLGYALQGQSLGTAGSLKWAQTLLDDTFIVLPADSFLDLDISAAMEHHLAAKCAATVIERHTAQDDLIEPLPRQTPKGTGAYIFNAQVLELIPPRTPFDIQEQLLPAITHAGHSISCYEMTGYVNRLETFEDYRQIQKTILSGEEHETLKYFTLSGRKFSKDIWIGRNQIIHPTARLMPPVYIGDNCYIGGNVELGPDVVIGSNVVIDDEATIVQSAILDGTYVGQLVNVERRLVNKNLIIDLETADYMRVTDDFLLGQAFQADINRGLERVLDVLVAALAIIPTTIASLPLALLLLLTTGKIFKKVERQFNRPLSSGSEPKKVTFHLLQFNAESKQGGYNWLGRLLTRLEIHRWPELWNLLKGDLVLVGVKPISPEEIGRLNEQWQQPRHEQQPGLTGLWYTNTRRSSDLDECVVADLYYMATQNWREDMRILFQTPVCWLRRISD